MSAEQTDRTAGTDPFDRVRDFTGSLVAVITPFNKNGDVDHGALSELIAMHERNGTSGLFFLGVAGEGATLDDREFADFARTVLEADHALPHFIGCTGHHTGDTVERVRIAAAHGADGAVLTVPANMGPDQAQAARYFLDVADASPIPVGTFNNPARLLTDLDTATLLDVLNHPRIVLHKEGSPQTGRIGEILAARGGDVCFLADDSPDQDIICPALALGARGIANAAGNLLPRELAALARPWQDLSDLDGFKELYFRVRPLIAFLYSRRSPIGIKSLMNAAGLPAGHLRAPLTPMPDHETKAGLDLLRAYLRTADEGPSAASVTPFENLDRG
ncbi:MULTISPECIES: dihydrodipicolinate synthase family protein [unclassified Streptomyces]|uniref:dihydrodipicolinate synthase family protein n=1 Tax=unclassified Streptomyces TaxID=2593676 RepID=UPI0011E89DE0|nr:dihydrodipicolinate synthase family protein [Streptomyces sp. sk2.1]TXS79717.1 4-hydroxy-tetrahydrodipicolinate synthase [Streptomyces sp. sk2.1]